MRKLSKILALVLVLMMAFAVVSAFNFTTSAAETTKTIYLKPNSNWTQSNAWFAVYTWDGGDQWFTMTKSSTYSGYYECKVPSNIVNVIFVRMNPAKKITDCWDGKWNQSKDLQLSGSNNCYTISAGAWDKGSGSWSHKCAYAPATCTEPSKCSCGNTTGEPLGHTYGGVLDADCNVCGYIREVVCPHEETVVVTGTPATCTTAGLTDGTKCTACNSPVDAQEEIPALGHKWENDVCTVCNSSVVYFVNSGKWTTVNAHMWPAVGDGTAWPGAAMTKTDKTVHGYDVYKIEVNASYVNILFNNGSGTQTADLAVKSGKYYDNNNGDWFDSLDVIPKADAMTDVVLKGDFDAWKGVNAFRINDEGVKYVYVTLAANTTYEFKYCIGDAWYGASATLTSSSTSATFSSTQNANAKITTECAGEYLFVLDGTKITVTFVGHDMSEATCTAASTCKNCPHTVGTAPGHAYDNACDTDCNECGETRETSHTYDNACDTDCNVCGETRETSHAWVDATFEAPKTCSVCGATEGTALVAVAEVNGTKYTTLQAALEAANGGTVVLLRDIVMDATLKCPYGNPVGVAQKGGVLDGNGHTLTVNGSGNYYAIITYGGTIKNLTINAGFRAIVLYTPTEDVIIDNVTIYGDEIVYGLNTAEYPTLEGIDIVVKNSTICGWVSFAGDYASVSFENCEFVQGVAYDNAIGRLVRPYLSTTFTNCSFVKNAYLDLSALEAGETVTLVGCTVGGVDVTVDVFTTEEDHAEIPFTYEAPAGVELVLATVEDGVSFHRHNYVVGATVDPTCEEAGYTPYTCTTCGDTYKVDEIAALGHHMVAGEVVAPTFGAEGYTPYTCANGCGKTEKRDTVPALVAVAQIGEQKYASLQEALNVGGEVVLLTDIGLTDNKGLTVPAGVVVVLDLNGHVLGSNAAEAATSAVIVNRGTLTIKDSVGGGKITTAAVNPDLQTIPGYASNTVTNYGVLVLESGTIENTTNAGAAYAVDNSSNGVTATFTMNGGKLVATRCALRMFCNSAVYENNVTINGGEIVGGTRAIWIHLPGSDSTKAANGNLTINGGTLNGGSGQSLYVYTYGNNHTGTFVTITGGTFLNDVLFGGGTYKETQETVSITGGTFNGYLGRYLANDGWEDLTGDEGYHLVDGVIGTHVFADATCTAPKTCACGLTEGEALGHVDVAPCDHECDVCGLCLTDCVDANNNHKCDICGDVMSKCADADKNHFCDICGVQNSHCIDIPPYDHNCDWCGEKMSEHVYDNDCDADCNYCGAVVEGKGHVDVAPCDHECDACGLAISDCVDANNNHKCDICGDVMSKCTDDDQNHFCDICGVQNSHCIDIPPYDHNCDWCGEKMSEHEYDNDCDADCNYCGAVVEGKGHVDVAPCDHECDVCGLATSDCVDANNNHKCDICGDVMSKCTDDNQNHFCDICGVQNSHCIDIPPYDHNCDWCGEKMSEHNYVDGICDICGAKDPEHYFVMTIPEALAAADGTKVQVTGTVIKINQAWNNQFGNITVTIKDESGKELYLYRMKTNVTVGDIITVKGEIDIYNGKHQITSGSTATIDGHDTSYDYVEMTVTEVLASSKGKNVIVTGTVVKINEAWSSFNNMCVTIADENGNTLYVYRLATQVALNDIITITGTVDEYNGIQIGSGATAVKNGTHECSNWTGATCTVAGKCVVCGQLTGAKLDHTAGAAATCTTAQTCTVCGTELVAATGHVNTTTTTVDATCTTPGSTTVTCACGEVVSTTEIPVIAHNFVEGKCTVCEAADPDYVAPQPPVEDEPTEPEQPEDPTEPEQPAEEEETNFFAQIWAKILAVLQVVLGFFKGLFVKG